MNYYTQLKIALAAIGLVFWGYGYRVESPTLRWIGIAFLAVAVILRLVPKRLRDSDYPQK
jgi:hypothetical protein